MCRLDKSELCLRPLTFNSIVDQLQLSEQQKEDMLAVRKTWRDFLARYHSITCKNPAARALLANTVVFYVPQCAQRQSMHSPMFA